jgi:hypothetical protein
MKPWSDVEEAKLKRELAMKKSIAEISRIHGRDVSEIIEKLKDFR